MIKHHYVDSEMGECVGLISTEKLDRSGSIRGGFLFPQATTFENNSGSQSTVKTFDCFGAEFSLELQLRA